MTINEMELTGQAHEFLFTQNVAEPLIPENLNTYG